MRIKSLEKLLDKKYCLLTSNCTTAIYLILKNLNKKKKIVMVPANICIDVVLAIIFANKIPEILDIDKNFCLSSKKLKNYKKLNEVSAIIYPYMYGNISDINNVLKITKKNKIFLIEDIAPSLGLKASKNNFVGSLTDCSVTSFGQGKIIDFNQGGSVNINSKELYLKLINENSKLNTLNKNSELNYKNLKDNYYKIINKEISNNIFELKKLYKYKSSVIGRKNFSIKFLNKLNNNIEKIETINKSRKKISEIFNKYVKNSNINSVKHKSNGVYWRKNFIIKKNRNELLDYLIKNNIYARKYYTSLNKIFPFFKFKKVDYSNYIEDRIINFWVGKQTKIKDCFKINKLINNFYKNV